MTSSYPAPTAAKAAPAPFRLSARSRARLAAALALAASATTLWADGRVSGRVTDAATQSGLPGAEITVAGSTARAITAADGSFTLSLPAGTYELSSFYLGYPSQTVSVTVTDDATVPARFALGSTDDVVTLETFVVEGTREGQARALNQQRTSANLSNIISSDLSGQFPDKTIADAVKRLPGVTVETDTDTGGSEGRYISVRGLNADFNAVSVNGMRVSIADFGGSSRRVPLDVVSAKSADQIVVTKAVRPDQDADSIGGAVDIQTRSPLDREGVYASAEGGVGYSNLAQDYTSNYPYTDPSVELSASFSSPLDKEGKHGIAVSANLRDRAFLKQRIGTTGWGFDGTAYLPGGSSGTQGIAIQHFYDDVEAIGVNATYEWRPSELSSLRFDYNLSSRDTVRGRQRLFYAYFDGETGADTNGDGTYDTYSSSGSRVERNIRQFFETQTNQNFVLSGKTKTDQWAFDYFGGYNHGTFDGDPTKDINARFRSASSGTNTYVAGAEKPASIGSSLNENNPNLFQLRSLDRGSSTVTDDELAGGLNASREASLFGGEGAWKVGAKSRLFSRDYNKIENYFFNTNSWRLDTGPGGVGTSVADYSAKKTLGGAYDFGFFADPDKIRENANLLESGGFLNPATDNTLRALANSYENSEHIHAGFLQGDFTWDKLSVLAGARTEFTRVNFQGNSGSIDSFGDVVAVTPYDLTNDYVNVLPGVHFRYEQNKNLLFRASVNQTIARPRLSQLRPVNQVDDDAEEVTQGNIDLKAAKSTNFDLSGEYYFTNAGVLSLGGFYKDISDPAYDGRTPGAGIGGYTLVRPENADSAYVYGIELGYDQQLTFLPSPFDGLTAFMNYTWTQSEVDTGLPEFAGAELPLFNQVENTLNAGLAYEKRGFRTRVAMLYRSESLINIQTGTLPVAPNTVATYDPALSRYLDSSLTLDVTASYEFLENWQVFTEFSNVLDEPGRAYDGTGARFDYYEVTDWSAAVGLRWSL